MIATLFIAIILASIVFLTQSLRFLEIVLEAGSSGTSFWILTTLALPRFFEIILPLSTMAATLFIYNKLTMDSELVAIRAVGFSPLALARPAIVVGTIVTIILWNLTLWIAPISMAKMQKMRASLTSEFSSILFKEGVFNPVGKGLTVYIRKRNKDGELFGLMIHDTRDPTKPPSTILAKKGALIVSQGLQQVIVYEGTRQVFNDQTGILQRLNFDRYTIDLPKTATSEERWAEPDERTIFELMNPDMTLKRDTENLRNFSIEIHRRITAPLLAFAFPLIALAFLLTGPTNRRGNIRKLIAAIALSVLMQGLFITSYNLSRSSNTGLLLMYLLTILPPICCILTLSSLSETLKQKIFFKSRRKAA